MEREKSTVRLIDAERLKKHYAWWTGPVELTREDLDTIIDLQPTVEDRHV